MQKKLRLPIQEPETRSIHGLTAAAYYFRMDGSPSLKDLGRENHQDNTESDLEV